MSLAPGTRLGTYEILAPLGAGGMGEVYRARDTRLGRDVAVKVLPDALAHNPERLARFEREARVLAALNHPGIAAIFGVEEAGASRALVMELVEGPTLADRIERGVVELGEVLAVARQLAEALEFAHERGIVHRDLKPANVKLRPDGTVKVLDFGLARALDTEAPAAGADLTQSPTLTQRMTAAGVILGTAAYMSPEQARGREADRRADIFSFGAVLFEMLSGRRAFAGETASETLAAVMRDEPPWEALPPAVPGSVRSLLERCLAKDPRQRLQAIGEARIALESAAGTPARAPAGTGPEGTARRPGVAALAPWTIAALALGGLALTLWTGRSRPPAAIELSVVPAEGRPVGIDLAYQPMAISPGGRAVAYTARQGGRLTLRLRRLDAREDVELSGTDGARNCFFSPDGEWVAFFDSRRLRKVSVRGGTPVDLAETRQDRLGTWLDDGTIVYSPHISGPLYRIPDSGGRPVAVTRLDTTRNERTHRWPCALDGGPWVVFTVQTLASPGGYDDASIDAISVRTGERRHLFKGARRAAWAPGGHLVLARGSDLYAVPIDPRNPRITQDPVPVLAGVGGEASSGASYFGIAGDGTLAWIPGEEEKTREIGWFDRAGRWTPTGLPPGPYTSVAVSPDGARALVTAGAGGGSEDLWLADLTSGGTNQLTHGGRSGRPAWFPDASRFAYPRLEDSGDLAVVVRRPDGTGGERELYRASHPLVVTDVTRDGSRVVFCDYGSRGGSGRIHVVGVAGDAASDDLEAEGEGYELAGVVSPDGRWLAYVSNKTGREEVCIRRLGGARGSWQVSSGGGGGVRWGRDGELFFVSQESLRRVGILARGDGLVVGQPEEMFEVPPSPTEPSFRDYDYDPVSDRFLFTRPPRGKGELREIAVSLGWAGRLGEMGRAAARGGR